MATKPAEHPPEVIAIEMAKDRELRREERQALTAIPAADMAAAPLRTSFMPQSMGEAMQLATIMSRSTFVPQHCRGNEGNCLAIIMQAGRWGMDPFAVANKAYFTKEGAPPAFEAQLVNAVVNSSGALAGRLRIEFEGEGEALRCTVRGRLRADADDEKVRTQSIARISVRNSPLWKSDPEQQLGYYTTRAWARMHCPEVLLGVFTPDELEVDPERARVVSAVPPRRQAIEHKASLADELGDEIPAFDHDTGEVRDERGMTEVDEDTARALDQQDPASDPPATLHEELGREPIADQAQARDGATPVDKPVPSSVEGTPAKPAADPNAKKLTEIRGGLKNAKSMTYLDAIEADYDKIRAALADDVVTELDGQFHAKRRKLREAAK